MLMWIFHKCNSHVNFVQQFYELFLEGAQIFISPIAKIFNATALPIGNYCFLMKMGFNDDMTRALTVTLFVLWNFGM